MPQPASEPLAVRPLLWRLTLGLFTLLGSVVVLGFVLRGPIELLSDWFVRHGGLFGVFGMVMLTDTVPLTHEPVLLLGYSGGLGFWPVWATASAGSVLAGVNGWLLGRAVGGSRRVQALLARYRIEPFLRRYGLAAVAIAALTPFPYSVATWAAGAAKIPFWALFAGSMARLPKVLLYLSLIALGWNAGG